MVKIECFKNRPIPFLSYRLLEKYSFILYCLVLLSSVLFFNLVCFYFINSFHGGPIDLLLIPASAPRLV